MFSKPFFKFGTESDHNRKVTKQYQTMRSIFSAFTGLSLGLAFGSLVTGSLKTGFIFMGVSAIALTCYIATLKIYRRDSHEHLDFLYIELERIKWQAEEDTRAWARENDLNEEWEVLKLREAFEKSKQERESDDD